MKIEPLLPNQERGKQIQYSRIAARVAKKVQKHALNFYQTKYLKR
jgi:hypothetical protein